MSMESSTASSVPASTLPLPPPPPPQSSGSTTKQDRRRYKKLRKKATTAVGGPLSGLTSSSEWQEFQAGRKLFESNNNNNADGTEAPQEPDDDNNKEEGTTSLGVMMMGPQVRWRSIRHERENVLAEGAQQRDILYYMIDKSRSTAVPEQQQQQKNHSTSNTTTPANTTTNNNGKRARKDESSSSFVEMHSATNNNGKVPLPAWVTLHNWVANSSVLLLEVHVSSSMLLQSLQQKLATNITSSSSSNKIRSSSGKVSEINQYQCLTVATRWFSNQTPKSIAESFLYAAPPKPKKRSKKEAARARIADYGGLYKALRDMSLTNEQMVQENYPCISSMETPSVPTTAMTLPSLEDPTKISLLDAQSLIQPFLVQIPEREGKDTETYVAGPMVSEEEQSSSANNNICNVNGQIYALDCEMVDTVAGKALARFTLIQVQDYNANNKKSASKVVWDTLVQPDAKVTNFLTEWSGVSAALLDQGPTVRLAQVQAFLLRQLQPHDVLVGHSLENDLRACRFIHRTCVDTAVLFRPPNRTFKYSLRNLTFQLLKRTIQHSNQSHCSEEDAQASLDLAIRRAAEGPSFAVADTRSTNQWATLAKDRTTVAIGPTYWLQKHITSNPSAVHALSCQGIDDDTRKAVLAWVGSKRRADLIWGCFELDKEDEGDSFVQYVQEILQKTSVEGSVLGIALQARHAKAAQMFQHRRARQSGKTTLGWTDEEENRFIDLATESQQGSMLWISSKN